MSRCLRVNGDRRIFDSMLNVRKRLLNDQTYDQCSRKERKHLKVVIDVLPFFDLFDKHFPKNVSEKSGDHRRKKTIHFVTYTLQTSLLKILHYSSF